MSNIIWAMIALSALALVAGLLGWIDARKRARRIALGLEEEEETFVPTITEGCCGMHSTCERDSLLAAVSTSVVYYDDEELDRYQGTAREGYSSDAVEEFREVMLTLEEDDIAGWIRSLQHRGIELPEELRPELFLIVGEHRAYHMEHGPGDRH